MYRWGHTDLLMGEGLKPSNSHISLGALYKALSSYHCPQYGHNIVHLRICEVGRVTW